jgi:small subunit ribosomal protein S8
MFFRDGLANTLSAIRVGYIARHSTVSVPTTIFLITVLSSLQDVGAIESFYVETAASKKTAVITLAYINGAPAISDVKQVSKQSNRCYIQARQLRRFMLSRKGTALLSTSFGILSGGNAYLRGIGGELII